MNPSLYYTLGKQYTEAGENDQAVQTDLVCNVLWRGERDHLFFAGQVCICGSGRPKQAIVVFRQAVKPNPSDVERQDNLANAYRQNSQQEDA